MIDLVDDYVKDVCVSRCNDKSLKLKIYVRDLCETFGLKELMVMLDVDILVCYFVKSGTLIIS